MKGTGPLKVLLISYADYGGGAHRAISRIHDALCRYGQVFGVDSTLRVIKSEGKLPQVISGYPRVGPIASLLRTSRVFMRKLSKFLIRATGDKAVHSKASIHTGLGKEIEHSNADLVLINWIGDYTVSLDELAEIQKPIVIRLADHWFLLGNTHFPPPDDRGLRARKKTIARIRSLSRKSSSRYKETPVSRLEKNVVGTVAPSSAIRSLASADPHLAHKINAVIPNPIDDGFWSPVPRESARQFHDIPGNSFSIIFGAVDGFSDPRKGGQTFLEAMKLLIETHESPSAPIRVDSFGGRTKGQDQKFPWLHHHGHLNDDELRNLYSAGDVFVSTSLFETFGNTVLESMACGTAVIAFDIPAYRDLIEHGKTGLFASKSDPKDLARQISLAISEPEWLPNAGKSARDYATNCYHPQKIAEKYSDFLRQAAAIVAADSD